MLQLLSGLINTHLFYAYPSKKNNQEWIIERFNIHTGERKALGEGTNPNPSPNGRWIAFTRERKEEKRLWIMDPKGKNEK
ncbi:MAG: hypothetical protein K2Y08_05625 [Alphaproteobacteria bacterium]|nr:hypothetical protein [Alphaproteobacteria bacterium]